MGNKKLLIQKHRHKKGHLILTPLTMMMKTTKKKWEQMTLTIAIMFKKQDLMVMIPRGQIRLILKEKKGEKRKREVKEEKGKVKIRIGPSRQHLQEGVRGTLPKDALEHPETPSK